MAEYTPGQCNIGGAERRRRRLVGVAGYVATAIAAAAVAFLDLPPAAMLVTMVPLFGGAVGHLQARRSFCAGFARAGIYDVSGGGDDRRAVDDEAAREADLAAARRIFRDAALLAAAGSTLLALAWWAVA